jgi:tetratricopeptide (TPR) repeat protein
VGFLCYYPFLSCLQRLGLEAVNSSVLIDPGLFVKQVQPLLEANDPPALKAFLKANYNCLQITELLSCSDCDCRKVAALALSLVGTKCCIEGLSLQLRDQDPMVNQMAEHALWSLWFRLGTPEANQYVCRGSQALDRKAYREAITCFDKAIELDPKFAEAHNQRGLAYFLLEEFSQSIRDCKQTVEMMPCHFGAWAGMGHSYAHQGNLAEARNCYQRALEINPHMTEIREAMSEMKGK